MYANPHGHRLHAHPQIPFRPYSLGVAAVLDALAKPLT